MKATCGERELNLLAIQRMAFLGTSARLALLGFLDSGASLSLLSIRDVAALTGRPLQPGLPSPASFLAEAEGDALLLERLGARFACMTDPDYPAAFAEIPQPPFGVYLRGAAIPQDRPAVSIVGTRLPTGLGMATAFSLARDFALAGLPVVSGLARGRDGAAHRGALRGRGFTCAVLACGVEAVYPAAHRSLAASILESGGLLLSEYPPGTEIRKSRFPERNRLIAGLSRGTIVVEAPAGSGALITADFALEQGRDVFVASACLEGPRSAGLDRLASEGARAIGDGSEVRAEWGWEAMAASIPASSVSPWSDGLGPCADEGRRASLIEGLALAEALHAELCGLALAGSPAAMSAASLPSASLPSAIPPAGQE
jgi:DNA processing protein